MATWQCTGCGYIRERDVYYFMGICQICRGVFQLLPDVGDPAPAGAAAAVADEAELRPGHTRGYGGEA